MGIGEPIMPTPEELAKQQPEETAKDTTDSSRREMVDSSSRIAEKFETAIETMDLPEKEREQFRQEFHSRAAGKPEKAQKAIIGQILLKTMKRARELKNSEQESACPKCGSPTAPGANFCSQCGNKL